jgi:starch phosphorylase
LEVKLGGHTETYTDEQGRYRSRWVPFKIVKGVPYDTPILGFQTNTANTLRLWKAEAPESFDFEAFNKGDYFGAVHEKSECENITKVLYPNDESGKTTTTGAAVFLCVLLVARHDSANEDAKSATGTLS